MHITFHYALGVIIAGLASIWYNLSPLFFGLIVFAAFIPDLDIILKKFAKNKNHRMLFTHSIYIPVILFLLGLIFNENILYLMGFAYSTHVIVDLFDWGNNFLFTGKALGPKLLLGGIKHDQVPELLKKETIPKWFFTRRYYSSKITLLFEFLSLMGMIMLTLFFAKNYWYMLLGYIPMAAFHLIEYIIITQKLDLNKNED